MAEKVVKKFYLPTRIIMGEGSFEVLGEEAAKLGKIALVVGRNFLKKRKKEVERLLKDKGVVQEFYFMPPGEPTTEMVEEGRRIAEEKGVEMVIGIGGGSVLDCGKAISGVASKDKKVEEYLEGEPLPPPSLPFIAIPTTAGTGSEVTNNAVIKNTKKLYKKSLRADFLNPTIAILDPLLTLSLPPRVTAYSALDALTQLIESYVTLPSTPISEALSLKGLKLASLSIREVVRKGNDVNHRRNMLYASLLSGMALTTSGLGLVHGLAHPIGVRWNVPHGLVCAVLLPHGVRYNLEYARDKFSEISEILTRSPDPYYLPTFLTQLNWNMGIRERLRDWGIKEKDLRWIAENSFSGSMLKNPRPAKVEELIREVLIPAL